MNETEERKYKRTLLQKYAIPLDHLNFKFIGECRDTKLLEKIVRILRSGEEGYYPELTKAAEDQLRTLNPNSRILRIETPVLTKGMIDTKQWNTISSDLMDWSDKIKETDLKLNNKNNKNIIDIENKYPYPVRKSEMKDSIIKEENKSIKMKSVQKSYEDWEKYNPDYEILKMDVEEEKNKEEKKRKQKEKIKYLNDNLEEEIKREKKAIEEADYTEEEKNELALKEKEKGNECHKQQEYKDAIKHYTKSLMLSPSVIVYNNRAISYLKLKQFSNALKDANKALDRDPFNVKSLYRRAQAYENLKYYQRALNDYAKILEIDPTNKDAQTLLKKMEYRCKNKIIRMKIQEEDSSKPKKSGFVIPEPDANMKLTEWGHASMMCTCRHQPDWVDGNSNNYISSDLVVNSNKNASVKKDPTIKETPNLLEEDNALANLKNEINSSEPKLKVSPPKIQKIKIPKKISDSFEFIKIWQSIKNDETFELHYQVLKVIHPENLVSLIGKNLDADMLYIILNCLDKFFLQTHNNSQTYNIVLSYLYNLTKLPRFNINFLLLEDTRATNNIFLKLSKQNIPIPNDLKNEFKVEF